jgi:leucyl aminopeptidase
MPDVEWSTNEPPFRDGQLLAIPVRSDGIEALAARFGEPVRAAAQAARFRGKPGDTFAFTSVADNSLRHVMLFGVGAAITDAAGVRQLSHDAVREGNRLGAVEVVLDARSEPVLNGRAGECPWPAAHSGDLVAQGTELACYTYDRFLDADHRRPPTVTSVRVWSDHAAASEGSARGRIVAAAVARARDLTNGPAELVTPTYLADTAREIAQAEARHADVSIVVLDRDDCAARGMGCFLGVAKGSDEPRSAAAWC